MFPSVPEVRSHARNSNLAASRFWPSGTKRTRSLSRSSRALESETVPTAVQPVPPSVEYSQVPLLLTRVVMAMPSSAPLSRSEIELPNRLDITSPLFTSSSSVMDGSEGVPGVRTGAVFGVSSLSHRNRKGCPEDVPASTSNVLRDPKDVPFHTRKLNTSSCSTMDSITASVLGSASRVNVSMCAPRLGPICSPDHPAPAVQVW